MDAMMNQADHDLLIRLETQLSAHSAREAEVSRATLDKLTELATKFDQLKDSHNEQRRDIRELKDQRKDDDLRIATVEQKVDSLQDAAEKQAAVSEAISKSADRRAKRYMFITGAITFLLGAAPTIYGWITHLVNAGSHP